LPIKFATTQPLSTVIPPLIAQYYSGFELPISTDLKIEGADDCIDLLANNESDFLLSFREPNLKTSSLFIFKIKLR